MKKTIVNRFSAMIRWVILSTILIVLGACTMNTPIPVELGEQSVLIGYLLKSPVFISLSKIPALSGQFIKSAMVH
jgi:uncharacterized protein YcfL